VTELVLLAMSPIVAILAVFPLFVLGSAGLHSSKPGKRHWLAILLALMQAIWIALTAPIALEAMRCIHHS
jgi:hypothetical protein